MTLVGHLRGEGGVRLSTDEVRFVGALGVVRVGLAPVALVPALVLDEVDGLPLGDDQQQLPEVVAVGEARESAVGRPTAEAVEGAQGDILLVGRDPWQRA